MLVVTQHVTHLHNYINCSLSTSELIGHISRFNLYSFYALSGENLTTPALTFGMYVLIIFNSGHSTEILMNIPYYEAFNGTVLDESISTGVHAHGCGMQIVDVAHSKKFKWYNGYRGRVSIYTACGCG